jgi:aspartyl-tRNA(Asn)/glutamyl-tRNA(Gln) amidotransferase subunit A
MMSLSPCAADLEAGRVSASALVRRCLERIADRDGDLNAIWYLAADEALSAAWDSDRRRAAGAPLSPIDGMPVGLKDNIEVSGWPTTNGLGTSWIAERDAWVVTRLRALGAVPLCKLGMHEAALGATSDNPHHGAVQNPVRSGYTPGGSSGGSGAAIVAELVPLAFGSDTMGSVRIPAAYCGCVGYKPARDVLPLDGVFPLSPSLDHLGPLVARVDDAALIMTLLAPDWVEPRVRSNPRLLVPSGLERMGVEPDVLAVFGRAVEALRMDGRAEIEEADLGIDLSGLRKAGLLIVVAEGAEALAAVRSKTPDALSEALKGFLDFGLAAPDEKVAARRAVLDAAGPALTPVLSRYDAVMLPTTPQAAFPHGADVPANQADLTALANATGEAAISMPCGVTADGLPVGLQLVGPGVLQVAAWAEGVLAERGQGPASSVPANSYPTNSPPAAR